LKTNSEAGQATGRHRKFRVVNDSSTSAGGEQAKKTVLPAALLECHRPEHDIAGYFDRTRNAPDGQKAA